jgi:type VI secretion system protein ImpF
MTAPDFIPSLLDRLIDPRSMGSSAQGANLSGILEAVRRDTEDLLNTRRVPDPEVEAYPELSHSVFTYGVPELITRPALSQADREALGRIIAESIARHEPRLRDIKATPLSDTGTGSRALRFLITAVLRLEPAPSVEFETLVRLSTGQTELIPRSL